MMTAHYFTWWVHHFYWLYRTILALNWLHCHHETPNTYKSTARESILGTLTALTVHVISMFGIMSIAKLQNSTLPFTYAAQLIMRDTGAIITTSGALFAIGGTLNVCIMIAGTIMLAGARDKIFSTYHFCSVGSLFRYWASKY